MIHTYLKAYWYAYFNRNYKLEQIELTRQGLISKLKDQTKALYFTESKWNGKWCKGFYLRMWRRDKTIDKLRNRDYVEL